MAFWATPVWIDAYQARSMLACQVSSTPPRRASSRRSAAVLLTTALQVSASASAPPSRLSLSAATRRIGAT